MRGKGDLLQFLEDIVEWGEMLESHIRGFDEISFSQDLKTLHAVTRCVEVIGEASSRILKEFPEFVEAHPDLEFRSAYATRNRLTHGYGDADERVIWKTASETAPALVAGVREALEALEAAP